MGKAISILMLFVFLFSVLSFVNSFNTVFAQESLIAPIPRPDNEFGQNHYYQVYFDGEGEAAVGAKLEFQNLGSSNLSQITIEIPGNVRLIKAFQEVQEERCEQYDKGGVCIQWYPYWYEYKYYNLVYSVEKTSEFTRFVFDLPVELPATESTSLILYYKSDDYAWKNLRVFNFDFETIKYYGDIDYVRVAVSIPEDFIMKGSKSEIDYRSDFGLMEAAVPSAEGKASEALSSFSQNIQYVGGYVKTAQGLDPFENLHVKGKYSSSWFALYLMNILIWLAVLLALILAGILLVKKFVKSGKGKGKGKEMHIGMKVFWTSLGSAALSIIIFFGSTLLLQNLQMYFGYQYQFFILFFMFLLALVILILVFAPGIYLGIKHGLSVGIWTVALTIVWLFILSLIIVFFLSLLNSNEPIYPLYRTLSGVAEMAKAG